MSDVTEDLVEEILAKVPASSLKKLRYTCKSWNALFADQRFIKKHFDTAPKEYLDIILRQNSVSSVSVNLHGIDENIDPSIVLKGELNLNQCLHYNKSDKVDDSFEVFHCNGLLLCTNKSTVVVWNPCTDQTKLIESVDSSYYIYALGYENKISRHNYKILRILDYKSIESLEIYEFNSNSWKVLDHVDLDFELHLHGMSVKGNTYWIASANVVGYVENNFYFLISFDFTTERFGPRVGLPFQSHHYNFSRCRDTSTKDIISLSSVREERLSVLCHSTIFTIDIWITSDITETNAISRSKFLSIDIGYPLFLNSVTFSIDNEKKVAVFCETAHDADMDGIVIYIIEHDRWETVYLEDVSYILFLFSYVPSLIQI